MVRSCPRDRDQVDKRTLLELFQTLEVIPDSAAASKSEQQLAHHHCGKVDVICLANEVQEGLIAAAKCDVRTGIEHAV